MLREILHKDMKIRSEKKQQLQISEPPVTGKAFLNLKSWEQDFACTIFGQQLPLPYDNTAAANRSNQKEE